MLLEDDLSAGGFVDGVLESEPLSLVLPMDVVVVALAH